MPRRRQVVLPAYTCPSLVRVIQDLGLRAQLVDLSPTTLQVDPAALAEVLDETTLAVVHVHPFGIPLAVRSTIALAHGVGALVIEDAAQSMGAMLSGRRAGTHGDFGLFSFGPGKPLSTGGGGLLSVNLGRHRNLANQAWLGLPQPGHGASLVAAARLAAFTAAFHPRGWWLASQLGLHRAGDREESWGYALTALSSGQASIALEMLSQLDEINERRRRHARRLGQHLAQLPNDHVPEPDPEGEPIYLRLPVVVDSQERREALLARLWAAGVGAGRMYRYPLSQIFPVLADRPLPGAEALAGRLLTLPTHHYLGQNDLERIVACFEAEASTRSVGLNRAGVLTP
jgi:dTDP-4-amino-4,6-dideoxygalactose transaminase